MSKAGFSKNPREQGTLFLLTLSWLYPLSLTLICDPISCTPTLYFIIFSTNVCSHKAPELPRHPLHESLGSQE